MQMSLIFSDITLLQFIEGSRFDYQWELNLNNIARNMYENMSRKKILWEGKGKLLLVSNINLGCVYLHGNRKEVVEVNTFR